MWGLVWAVGFVGTYLRPGDAGTVWPVFGALGWAGTFGIVLIQRRAAGRVGLGTRYAASAAILGLYAGVWALVLMSGHANAPGICAGSVTGFAYLVAGLWRGPLLAWLGLAVTVLFLAGFLVPAPAFLLCAGLVGGGGLAVAGLLLARRDPT